MIININLYIDILKRVGRCVYLASIICIVIYRTNTIDPDTHNWLVLALALVKAKAKAKALPYILKDIYYSRANL